jgi:Family of unknown function (DUF6221)
MRGMSDPASFATARLYEDEAAAKAACGSDWRQGGVRWVMRTHPSDIQMIRTDAGLAVIYDNGSPTEDEACHIALHDPARALRDVEAGRRILERHQPKPDGTCSWCLEEKLAYPEEWQRMTWPCPEFRDLLARWADHPGYDQEWKPLSA